MFCFVSTSEFLTEKYWRTVNAQRKHLGPTTVGNHAAGALSPMAPMLPAAFTESFITDQEDTAGSVQEAQEAPQGRSALLGVIRKALTWMLSLVSLVL